MNPSAPFIKRPIATSLFMFAILLSGIFAYSLLPVSSLPQVEYPTMQVLTFYPGASPDVTASTITAPLEKQFGQMPGLNQMTSTSSTGMSLISLQFSLDLSLDVAEQEVQAAINAATTYLPTDLPTPPVYSKVNPADTPIVTLALTSKTMPLPQVEDYADTRLAQRISQLSGVGLVSISGGQRPAVRVQVNPRLLASYGVNLEDVRTAISANNVNAAKGFFDGKALSYTINSNDQLLKSPEYQSLIIAYRNAAPIRLSNVATILDGVEDVRKAAWMNLTPAVILNIKRQPGSNVIAVADRVKQLLTKLKSVLPAAIDVSILTDQTITIRSSVKDVQFELMISVCLVVMVIFLFLRNIRATIIPSISVPLSLIGTFGAMYFLGFSLNNLTLMALTIATGFVVDDAIVMIENISRYLEQGEPPLQAALKGAGQIGFTIMSLTISLVAVLIPLLFMSDIIGRLFREFALTLAICVLISALVSLTLTPMLCSKLLKSERSSGEGWQKKIIEYYDTGLRFVLSHQPLTLLIAIITLLITLFLFYLIPKGFFPIQDTGVIQGISVANQAISFEAMAVQQQELARVILKDPAVLNLSSFIGIDGENTTLNSGRILITLKPVGERDANATNIIRRLQPQLNQIPGISLYMQPVQDITVENRVSQAQFQLSVGSSNAAEVVTWSNLLLNQFKKNALLQDAASDLQNSGLQTFITIDRDTASRLGITPSMIDNTLYDAFGQRQISTLFTQRNQYHVILESQPIGKPWMETLDQIYINASNGRPIPLSVFSTVNQSSGPVAINRQGQFPVATLSFNLAPNASLGEAMNAVNQKMTELHVPDSVQTSFEGAAKIFQSSLANEGWLVLAAILTVYIILGVLYESYIHPITILSTLPSACMGALIALLLTGNELSVIALIGIILLIGIVMKNAILMIDFALEQERKYNKPPAEAIHQAALLRFRPILMTTLAALFGAVPLACAMGTGAELRRPLGIAIIGGLTVSQLLTLFTTPIIYLAFDRLNREASAFMGAFKSREQE